MQDRSGYREQVWGVVVAAGSGVRFGAPKHGVLLGGKALWEWARDALLDSGAHKVVVVGPVPGGVEGGSERHLSVSRGLDMVDPAATIVAVHDAARPLASARMISQMYGVLRDRRVDGVIPVVPIPDSIKRLEPEKGRVLSTLNRTEVFAAQTPQVFRASVLRRAHAVFRASGSPESVPDDAALVEMIGGRVATVPGDRLAMKITYPEHLVLAEALVSTLLDSKRPGGILSDHMRRSGLWESYRLVISRRVQIGDDGDEG